MTPDAKNAPAGGRGRVLNCLGCTGLAVLLIVGLTTSSSGFDRYELPANLTVIESVRELAGRHEHGWRDQLPPMALDLVAAQGKVESTCGYVSAWVVAHLIAAGIEARVVHSLTLDEWDDVNNGHTMVEARVEGEWVLFDVDRDVWFWQDGRPLSLVELVDVVPSGGYEIRPLSGDPVQEEQAMRVDDRRLLQVPIIEDGGRWFFSDNEERVLLYPATYQPLSEAEWRERFYT